MSQIRALLDSDPRGLDVDADVLARCAMHPHCRLCAEACRACAQACRELLDALGR
jgi:hypothetical protein